LEFPDKWIDRQKKELKNCGKKGFNAKLSEADLINIEEWAKEVGNPQLGESR
jgi:hypothetical protein